MRLFPIWLILVVVIVGVAWRFGLRALARRYNISGAWYFLAWVAFAFLAVLFRITVLRHVR